MRVKKRQCQFLILFSVVMVSAIILLSKYVLRNFRLTLSQMVIMIGCFAILSYALMMICFHISDDLFKQSHHLVVRIGTMIAVLTLALSLCTFYITNRYILTPKGHMERQGGVTPTMPTHFDDMKKLSK